MIINFKDYAQLLYDTLKSKPEDGMGKILSRFSALLIKNKILYLKNSILKEFQRIEAKNIDEEITYISGTSELKDADRKELENMFPGPKNFLTNPNLLGGIAVRQKDVLYNGTLKKRIEILKALL